MEPIYKLPAGYKYQWWTVGAQLGQTFRLIKVRVVGEGSHFSAVEYQIRCKEGMLIKSCIEALYDIIETEIGKTLHV